MEKDKFLNLVAKRNVVNLDEINDYLDNLVLDKQLKEFHHIEKWVYSNVRKYFINVLPVNKHELSDLSSNTQNFIKQKNIAPPYHIVNISNELIDSLKHCIDYLKSEFSEPKDLSRLTIQQI